MNAPPAWPRRGLYAISPDESDTVRLLERVEPVLRAGATLLQYRNKPADSALRREQAGALRVLCRAHEVPFIVNDDVDLAAELGADGVHLGADDGELAQARLRLGPAAIIGASCYNEVDRARSAARAGASYLAFGACHDSTTKPGRPRAEPALFTQARGLGLPLVAIGGLRPDNAAIFIAAGADLIAVIGGLFDTPDPGAAAQSYLDLFRNPPQ